MNIKGNYTRIFKENLKAYNEGYRIIGHKGSSRSSKSWSILQGLDTIARYSPKSRIISIVSQTFPHLKAGVIRDYIKYLTQMGWYSDKMHNKSDHFFNVGNSIIEYFSSDNADKVHGPARDILYLNEPNKGISFDSWNQMSIRTNECIFFDYNPSGIFYIHKEGIITDIDCKMIHSTWKDNIKNLSKAQLNEFAKNKKKSENSDYWRYWWRVYGEGEDAVLLEERIMPFIDYVDKIPSEAIRIPTGLDFGFSPDPTSVSNHWIRKNENDLDDLYLEEVIYETRLSINTKSPERKNLVQKLEESGFNKSTLIIAECADPRSIEEMRRVGFNIEAVRKESVENSIKLFHDYNIHFLKGSDNIYDEFDNYKYKSDRDGIILGIPTPGQQDHGIDNTRYILMSRNKRWSV